MSRPLRVLQYITPSGIGGAELHVAALTERLRARGHDVTVICPEGRPLLAELHARGLPVRSPRTQGKVDPAMLARLVRWMRGGRVDLVHTHLSTASLLGSWAARLTGTPCVATVHGLNSWTCFRWAHRIVAVSEAVRQHLAAQGAPESRLTVVHNGIDLEAAARPFDDASLRAAWGLPPEAPVLVTVGRLAPEKGQSYLVQALALLLQREEWKELRLLVVGTGSLLEALQADAARAGVASRVLFTGFQRDVLPFVHAAQVFVLPSLQEGLSLSALEAMALERPVVACRVGGTPEVVEEGVTGLLVPPGHPAALAEALAQLLGDPERARRMGEAGAARVRTAFDLEHMVTRLERVYADLLASRGT